MNLTATGKGARPLLGRDGPAWGWGLDVLMAVLILLSLNALALTAWRPAIFKARATEQMLAGTTWRTDVVEHFSVNGEWPASNGSVPADFAKVAPGAIKWQSRYAAAGIVNGVVVTLGHYPGQVDGVAIIAFRPAVANAAEQPTVRWLCGHARAPAGWQGPEVSPVANLPDDLLYSQCRMRMAG